jgi:hypothetical protein
LGVMASGSPSRETLAVEEILKKAEDKIAASIDLIKKMPENPFFARTGTSLKEQQNLAAIRVEMIKKLLKPGSSECPDYGKILQLNRDILVKAPNTKSAQTAHWDLHKYNLIWGNTQGAKDALMTYLYKYETDKGHRKEAFDKLANFAANEKEWDMALYYSEKYLILEPDSYPRLLNKARALVNLGFLAEGKALLQRVAEANSASVEANLARSALKELEFAKFNPALLTGYRETMENMRKIATAAERYFIEYMKYPRAIKDLFPDFLEKFTEKDAWGSAFICQSDPDNNRFLIASPGSDGVFEGFDQEGFYVDLTGKDIIFANGAFIYAPRLQAP